MKYAVSYYNGNATYLFGPFADEDAAYTWAGDQPYDCHVSVINPPALAGTGSEMA